MSRLLLALLLIGLAITPADSQPKKTSKPTTKAETAFKIRVRVFLTFKGPEESILKQCLYRELRNIPEVMIVEDNNELNRFEIHMVVVDTQSQANFKTGYASATAVLSPANLPFLNSVLQDEKDKSLIAAMLGGAGTLDGLEVMTGPTLTSICKTIGASFDTQNVEPLRQFMQTLNANK